MNLRSRRALGDISNSGVDDSSHIKGPRTKKHRASADRDLADTIIDDEISYVEDGNASAGIFSEDDADQKLETLEDQRRMERCNLPPPAVEDYDVPDLGNQLACAEYVSDMYQRYRRMEELFCPSVYMHMQDDINEKMRSILIDWIAEVHLKFKLAPSTLYLTVHIIDRFCMLENVHRGKLQLVGVTALLIACKYEEVLPPEVRDCVYITDHAYNREEVLAMEKRILARLKFYVTVPTTWNFLSRILNVAKVTAVQYQRACYYSERALQEHGILAYRPSLIAATAVHLALVYDAGGDYSSDAAWPAHLAEYCNTSAEQMHACAHQMLAYLQAEPVTASRRHLVAVKKKFSHDRYLSVASERLPEPPSRDCNY